MYLDGKNNNKVVHYTITILTKYRNNNYTGSCIIHRPSRYLKAAMSEENLAASTGELPVGSNLEERCLSVLQSGLWADCKFIVGQDEDKEEVPAIKSLLGMASPVFASMFFGQLAETKPVELPDVDPAAFDTLLQFVYVRKVEFSSVDEALKVIAVADKYMIPDLIQACVSYLESCDIDDVKHVTEILNIGFLCNIEELKLIGLDVFCDKANTFLNEPEILNLSDESAAYVFNQTGLNVNSDEMKVINAAIRWAMAHCGEQKCPVRGATLRTILEEAHVFNQLRFLTLTAEQLADGPVTAEILTTDEASSISKYICTGGITSLPVLINMNTIPRNKIQHEVIDLLTQGIAKHIDPGNDKFDKFTVKDDQSYILQGVTLPTQALKFRHPNDGKPYSYEEHLNVEVTLNGSLYATGSYKGKVYYNNEVVVWLEHLKTLTANRVIKNGSQISVKVTFQKAGKYYFLETGNNSPRITYSQRSGIVRSLTIIKSTST